MTIDNFWIWHLIILLRKIMQASIILIMLIITPCLQRITRYIVILRSLNSSVRFLLRIVLPFRMSGMRTRRKQTEFTFLMIQRIRIVRLARLILRNSDMRKMIRGFQSLTIPQHTTVRTENHYSMRTIREVSWMYHSCSVCLIKQSLMGTKRQALSLTEVISAGKISDTQINVAMIL